VSVVGKTPDENSLSATPLFGIVEKSYFRATPEDDSALSQRNDVNGYSIVRCDL
jgi:hypothetical protein